MNTDLCNLCKSVAKNQIQEADPVNMTPPAESIDVFTGERQPLKNYAPKAKQRANEFKQRPTFSHYANVHKPPRPTLHIQRYCVCVSWTLRELARTANARIYIGFDKHVQSSNANGDREE